MVLEVEDNKKFNSRQYELLKDKNSWKQWRIDNPKDEVWLEGADLSGVHMQGADLSNALLKGADLTDARLEHANLTGAHFEGADLTGAHLGHANLTDAHFEDADLIGIDLKNADLNDVHLEGASLNNAHLENADLTDAHFEGADLTGAHLDGADLTDAHFEDTNLMGIHLERATLYGTHFERSDLSHAYLDSANLSGAYLQDADLSYTSLKEAVLYEAYLDGAYLYNTNLILADLTGVIGLELHNTMIRNARFSPNAPDLWSVLRRTYTGHRLILNLLFFMAFILPYVAKTLFWVGVNNTQEASVVFLSKTQSVIIPEELNNFALCLSEVCDKSSVWELVIGFDKGPIFWILTSLLILYNLCKIGLTWLVSPLKEEEDRSGHSPMLGPSLEGANHTGVMVRIMFLRSYLQTYGWMVWPHRFVTILFWLAIFTFFIHGYDWLSSAVYIPAGK